LETSKSEDGGAHAPEFSEVEFQADDEEHEDDSKLRKVEDFLRVPVGEAKEGRSDNGSDNEVAKDRSDAEASAEWSGQGGGGEVDEGVEEERRVHF